MERAIRMFAGAERATRYGNEVNGTKEFVTAWRENSGTAT